MSKIIVIESGTDASGKETQTNELYERLKKENYKVVKFSFPNYKSKSSEIVKMYLEGNFGNNAEEINPYITSTFFAVDRYATFKTEIEKYYNDNYLIIIDRYTTSNMTYQASKINGIKERDDFLNWLYDYEFNFYKLPKPDLVLFLDLPVDKANILLVKRKEKNKKEGTEILKEDIHEKDSEYLKKAYYNAKYVSSKYNWNEIYCLNENNELKSIKEISDEIYDIVEKNILKNEYKK